MRGFAGFAGFVGVVAGLFVTPSAAMAATYTPTRFDDPTPGTCKPHDCSLREALGAATSGSDKIVLSKGTYNMQIPAVPGDLGPNNGDFDAVAPVKIQGAGAKKTKIDANGLDRVFRVGGVQSTKAVTFKSLTLKGGDATAVNDGQHPDQGGAIYAYTDKVALKNVVVRGNVAAFGGGIQAQAGRLTITNSTIAGNIASEGGGIHASVALNFTFGSLVTNIRSSTISGNFASKGGGILADGSGANMSLKLPQIYMTNSTVAGNQTSAEAGGIMADNNAIVTLDNSTVAYNTADDDNTGGGVGGGIHQHSGATFNVGDSIVASNEVGSSGSDDDCSGTFVGSGNVLTAASGCASLPAGPNLFVGSALIGPLDQNGGPTRTVKLLPTSPALGFAETCPSKDQRGVKRPHDNCDSGSYERKGN
jgi:hypothetical protein